jgi:hypothetical protein
MKKYVIICLALGLLSSVNVSAQAFKKGSLNFDLGIGFGGYGTEQTQTTSISALVSFPGFSFPIESDTTFSTTDGAASVIIPFSFEYGISDKIGLGLDLTSSNYIIDNDDKEFLNSVKGFDFGLKVNYHLLNSDKNDLFVGLGLGMSSVKWTYKDDLVNNPYGLSSASGSGSYFSLGITDRIFITDRIGILFNLEYRGYNYTGIETEADPSNAFSGLGVAGVTDIKFEQSLDWKLSGEHFGTGLAVKF